MQRLKMVTSVIACALVSAGLLAGNGYECAMRPHGAPMAGMAATAPAHAGHNHTMPDHTPARPDGCQSLAPCAVAALATETAATPGSFPAKHTVATATFLRPPSETISPDLPPPRA